MINLDNGNNVNRLNEKRQADARELYMTTSLKLVALDRCGYVEVGRNVKNELNMLINKCIDSPSYCSMIESTYKVTDVASFFH